MMMHRVTDVWVNGKCLMKDRELITINLEELKQLSEKWNDRLTAFKKELAN